MKRRLILSLLSFLLISAPARTEFVPQSISDSLVHIYAGLSVFWGERLILFRPDGTYQTLFDRGSDPTNPSTTVTSSPESGTYTYQTIPEASGYTSGYKGIITFTSGHTGRHLPVLEFGNDRKGEGATYVNVYSPVAPDGPVNVSNNAWVSASGNHPNITGFVIAGDSPQWVLIRGVGSSLAQFGISDYLTTPNVVLHSPYSTEKTVEALNQNANLSKGLETAYTLAGAFALMENSSDCAGLFLLQPGNHTIVSSSSTTDGRLLAEVYVLSYKRNK